MLQVKKLKNKWLTNFSKYAQLVSGRAMFQYKE